jgi:hypothetical protein
MARIDVVHGHTANWLFYNLDAAVGDNCPNLRYDVLLVQYLLKEGCKAPHFAAIQTGAGFTQDVMQITGTWDQVWGGYLSNYLRTIARLGRPVVEDRRVDPVVAGHTRGSVHHMQYTIFYLNLGYLQLRPIDYPRLSEVGDCPAEVRSTLKVQFIRGDK